MLPVIYRIKNNIMKKIWQKNKDLKVDKANETYLVSKGIPDNELVPYDVKASKAHANMLMKIGVLNDKENVELQEGLDKVLELWGKGEFKVEVADEDCHTAIEKFLTENYGEVGKKIHTGRSRNDQVVTASRLYMREKLDGVAGGVVDLAKQFLDMAKKYQNVPFPGYTHQQQAMLSSLGHYFMSFSESLIDDEKILKAVSELINQNPLGSAAGFGVSLPLDREMTAKEMGFSKVQVNSLYCQTSRGKFESFLMEGVMQVMMTLGRFAQDMIIFTMQEFDYFSVDESMTTGSSIMPQKKNLDYMEVLRGQQSMMMGMHTQVQSLVAGKMSGYNKDLKFVKKIMMDAFEIAEQSIVVVGKMLSAIVPNEEIIKSKISKGIFAADIANDMVVNDGIAFRDAYKKAMEKLENTEIDFGENIKSKKSLGSPGNLGMN